jgi:hypothetical protein
MISVLRLSICPSPISRQALHISRWKRPTDQLKQSIHIQFPFVDLLGDGYSSFAWENNLLLTSTNQVAIDATATYGQTPVPATFIPLLEAYEYAKSAESRSREISFEAYTTDYNKKNCPAISTKFAPLPEVGPWPLSL